MTKREVKDGLVSALQKQGIHYSDRYDVVYFGDIGVVFDTDYINIIHGHVSVYYPLSALSYISIMAGALWISVAGDYNFTVIRFEQLKKTTIAKRDILIDETEQEDEAMMNELEDLLLSEDWD